jgi:ATP-dependent Clp protease, protease subunit
MRYKVLTFASRSIDFHKRKHYVMTKKLVINVSSEGQEGRISIIGEISEWNSNSAENFRAKCQELKDSGIKSALVYLMTVGGDCFQANEITNILDEFFPGSFDGEGGALVASAGTYIAVRCRAFTLAKNGQFMIHKPSAFFGGNETELNNQLTLLQNMTKQYYDAYLAKCTKPEKEFKAKWDAGDFWMTAEQAKEWGFVTSVKEPVKIDEPTAKMIMACGSPNKVLIDTLDKSMDTKITAVAVGLPEDATEQQINAKIAELKGKADSFNSLKAETDRKDKETKATTIKDALDKAIQEKRIKADTRKHWEGLFEKDYESTMTLLKSQEALPKLSAEIKVGEDGAGATYKGKTFEQWQEADPDMLASLEDNDPEAFGKLFDDWKKRNKIK